LSRSIRFDSTRFDGFEIDRARESSLLSRARRVASVARARVDRASTCVERARVARATRADAVVHKPKTPRVGYRDSALGKIT
jgi:hypothetical protein